MYNKNFIIYYFMREEPEVSFESIYSKHSEYGIKDQLIIEDVKKTWTASLS